MKRFHSRLNMLQDMRYNDDLAQDNPHHGDQREQQADHHQRKDRRDVLPHGKIQIRIANKTRPAAISAIHMSGSLKCRGSLNAGH